MQRPSRRTTALLVVGAVVAVAAAGTGAAVVLGQRADRERDEAARAAAEQVVAAWTAGDLAGAPVVLAGGGGADAVAAAEEAVTAGMGDLEPSVELVDVERDEATASADLRVTWPVGDGWTSETSLPLAATGEDREASGWTATWSPSALAPSLEDGDALRLDRVRAGRGQVLDRDGEPLVTDRPVVDVSVAPARAGDPGTLAQGLSDVLGVDAGSLAERIASAPQDRAVPVITLRQEAFDAVRAELDALPGVQWVSGRRALAPTSGFARDLLGVVGDATAEVVEGSGGRVAAGDQAGLSGVQRQYDERLAGTAGATVVRVPGGAEDAVGEAGGDTDEDTGGDAGGDTAAEEQVLFSQGPVPGEDVQLSLDPQVQLAADAALTGRLGDAGVGAAVVVDVASGDLLAVSSTPAGGFDRALQGRYAPGSTFKTVSTQALLAGGLSVDEVVPCPPSVTVGGRTFGNAEGGALGQVPFSTAFAQSCNTAFVSLADRLDAGALPAAAAPMGLGVDWSVGVPAFTGEVPEAGSEDLQAAEMIGQGQVLASPAGMAVLTSTIARGSWLPPRVVLDPAPEEGAAPPEPVADLGAVRDLMRLVATEGTASAALAGLPGAPVGAKTGTAEVGQPDADGTYPTNAWTVAFQPGTGPAGPDGEGVAVAVVVEGGSAGGAVAAPVVADLLTALADEG
ncbi:penicillin-binding transpeptidase domain-containing protein [uncultured Pseudokineococcus sp.]|uniref:penicillin-binding transpeptidase domain-containing protein n=1 Tax=uncultured Pseudokineococcus sp. TaxID=1642928 RepID=UPI002624F0EE|nr:penicillin-binding transpeptidase domain-containing protein [uncultured Pseudokineococcus sp.]